MCSTSSTLSRCRFWDSVSLSFHLFPLMNCSFDYFCLDIVSFIFFPCLASRNQAKLLIDDDWLYHLSLHFSVTVHFISFLLILQSISQSRVHCSVHSTLSLCIELRGTHLRISTSQTTRNSNEKMIASTHWNPRERVGSGCPVSSIRWAMVTSRVW